MGHLAVVDINYCSYNYNVLFIKCIRNVVQPDIKSPKVVSFGPFWPNLASFVSDWFNVNPDWLEIDLKKISE